MVRYRKRRRILALGYRKIAIQKFTSMPSKHSQKSAMEIGMRPPDVMCLNFFWSYF